MLHKKNVIVFLCTDYIGAVDQIADLSNTINETELQIMVVTDHSDTTSMLRSSSLISGRDNILFLGNDTVSFENHSDIAKRDSICARFHRNNSYFNLFSVDYDRFSSLGLPFPSACNLRGAFLEFITMFQYLHANFDVVLTFSEGPHNFFLRTYDCFRDETSFSGRYIYLRPGRVGESFYLQDAASKKAIVEDTYKYNEVDDSSPFYMATDAPLMRSIIWKMRNIRRTSAYNTFRKIRRTKGMRVSFFDKPNIVSLLISLWFRELRSQFITITGGLNKILAKQLPSRRVVVYPEHYHPEASTSAYDFTLCNDYENAVRIRKALPEAFTLVYKLHPSNKNRHPKGLLKKLSQLPGVLLVEKPLDLGDEKKELMLISVSSTMILDFVENQQPVIVIGNPEFCQVPNLELRVMKTSLEKFEQNTMGIVSQAQIKAANEEPIFSRKTLIGQLYTPKDKLISIILKLVKVGQK